MSFNVRTLFWKKDFVFPGRLLFMKASQARSLLIVLLANFSIYLEHLANEINLKLGYFTLFVVVVLFFFALIIWLFFKLYSHQISLSLILLEQEYPGTIQRMEKMLFLRKHQDPGTMWNSVGEFLTLFFTKTTKRRVNKTTTLESSQPSTFLFFWSLAGPPAKQSNLWAMWRSCVSYNSLLHGAENSTITDFT